MFFTRLFSLLLCIVNCANVGLVDYICVSSCDQHFGLQAKSRLNVVVLVVSFFY